VAMIVWYGGGRVLLGAITFGTLVAFLEYAQKFFGPIKELGSYYSVMQSAMASSERLFALLDIRPEIVSPAAPAVLPSRPARPARPPRRVRRRGGLRRRALPVSGRRRGPLWSVLFGRSRREGRPRRLDRRRQDDHRAAAHTALRRRPRRHPDRRSRHPRARSA